MQVEPRGGAGGRAGADRGDAAGRYLIAVLLARSAARAGARTLLNATGRRGRVRTDRLAGA